MALTDGILAYWKLDDSSWVDATGNGYTLADAGSSNVGLGSGIINNGAYTEAGSYLYNGDIAVGDSYSVSLWVNPISFTSNFDAVWSFDSSDSPTGIVGEGQSYFFVGNKGDGDYNLNPKYGQASGWTHFVYVVDNVNHEQNFYVNGNLVASGGDAGNWGNWSGFFLGAYPGRSLGSNSHIDEVGVWNRALSASEVGDLYSLGNALPYPFLVLYYNNAQEDGDWGNLLNWWQDEAFSIPAEFLPSNISHVNLYSEVTQNTAGGYCYCYNGSFWSANFGAGLTLYSTGILNMQGSSVFAGTTTDGVSMHDSSTLTITSVVDGDVTMRGGSRAYGTILGNATVHYDNGDGQYPIGGTVLGSVTYYGFNFGQTCYFSQIQNGLLSNSNNWFLDAGRTIPAEFSPDDRNDVVFSGMETIAGITGGIDESITYNSISCDGVVFSAYELNYFTVIATNGITAINSFFRQVTIEANGSYTNCTFAEEYGSSYFVGNISLRNCTGIYTNDEDIPNWAIFNGIVNAYYPTSIASGAVTGTLTRHGYGLLQTCIAHCHLDETSGTRAILDLYEEPFISQIVIIGASLIDCNGTYTRTTGDNTSFGQVNGLNSINYLSGLWTISTQNEDYSQPPYTSSDNFATWQSIYPGLELPTTESTSTSPIVVGYGTGLIGNAAKFNGNSLINNDNNNDNQLQVEFSISVWVKKSIYAGIEQAIFGTGLSYGTGLTIYFDEITNPVFPFQPIGSKLKLYMDSAHGDTLSSDPIILNDWYHCVATITPNRTKFYVNGEYIGVINEQDAFNTGGIALSKFYGGNRLQDNTLVDELNLFNIELNQTQVNKLYNNGLGLGYPFNLAGAKKIDLYKLLGIPFPAKDYKYSRLTNLPFFVKI